jgi:hypothetical protein
MRRYFDGTNMIAIDGQYEFDLGFCYRRIKAWKQWRFRKNSRWPANIKLQADIREGDPDYHRLYLVLFVKGELVEQYRICAEAYEVLERDMPLDFSPGLETVTLASFSPIKSPFKTEQTPAKIKNEKNKDNKAPNRY